MFPSCCLESPRLGPGRKTRCKCLCMYRVIVRSCVPRFGSYPCRKSHRNARVESLSFLWKTNGIGDNTRKMLCHHAHLNRLGLFQTSMGELSCFHQRRSYDILQDRTEHSYQFAFLLETEYNTKCHNKIACLVTPHPVADFSPEH